jgi:hypothetical protein
MALFKYANRLSQVKHSSFDVPFKPSSFVPCAGIFYCAGCGVEIALEGTGLFPDSRHHTHRPAQGPIVWQLAIAAVSDLPQPYLHGAAG